MNDNKIIEWVIVIILVGLLIWAEVGNLINAVKTKRKQIPTVGEVAEAEHNKWWWKEVCVPLFSGLFVIAFVGYILYMIVK